MTISSRGQTGTRRVPISIASLDPPEINHRLAPQVAQIPPGPPENRFCDSGAGPANLAETFRHSGWRSQRHRIYDAFFRTRQSPSRIEAFRACGSNAHVYESDTELGVYRIGGSACHDRFCLPCTRQRAQIIAANITERLAGQRARFITLTIATEGLSLDDAIGKLHHAFTRLLRTTLWRDTVTAGVAFIELKYDHNANRWHPHLHAITQGRFIPHASLKALWRKITGDSYIVHIRLVRSNDDVVRYVTTYCSKTMRSTDFPTSESLDQAIIALRGKRLCRTFGIWRGAPLTVVQPDGTWTSVGSLDALLRRSLDGDADALRIISAVVSVERLRQLADANPRPPPTPFSTPIDDCRQSLLFPHLYTGY